MGVRVGDAVGVPVHSACLGGKAYNKEIWKYKKE